MVPLIQLELISMHNASPVLLSICQDSSFLLVNTKGRPVSRQPNLGHGFDQLFIFFYQI